MPETALTVRPLAADEMSLFTTLADPGGPAGAGFGPPGRDFRAVADEGRYRPGWTCVAQVGDEGPVVARAAFWGGPDGPWPLALDWFDVASGLPAADGVAAGTALLRAALPAMSPPSGRPPEYHLFLPPDWREEQAVRPLVDRRVEAATRPGWSPSSNASASSGGRPAATARHRTTARGRARPSAPACACARWATTPSCWRCSSASSPARSTPTPAGTSPARAWPPPPGSSSTPWRGCRRPDRVVADTDTGNAPMAAAFAAAGWAVTARRLVLSAPGA